MIKSERKTFRFCVAAKSALRGFLHSQKKLRISLLLP